jgi:hypothetical protein
MTEYEHEHKFFVFQVKADFQPLPLDENGKQLYERYEYAVLGCNCGKVVKTKVKEQ